MEPHWRDSVLRQGAYFSKSFEEDLDYDRSTREDFHKEIQERESKITENLLQRKPHLKRFVEVLDTDNRVTSRLKTSHEESVFQPSRNYWPSYIDYITYSLCPFVMQFEVYALMKHLLSKGTGFICVTAFAVTKIFVNWILTYIMIGLGAYHKQGIFHLRYLLPISKYFPYITTGMIVWNMSSRIDLYSEILLYFVLYLLAEIYIIDLKFSDCTEVLPLPVGVECYSPIIDYQVDRFDCGRVKLQEFIFQCADRRKFLLPEQVILQYMHYNAKYVFMRNCSMLILFFILLFASGRVHKLLRLIRIAMCIRLVLYIFMIILSREILTSGIFGKLDNGNNWSYKSFFFFSRTFFKDIFIGCVAGIRDLPSLLSVQWGGTARISGSTKPARDSIFIILADMVISGVELLLLIMVYTISMDQTMLWIAPIIGFRTRRIPLVPIYIFVRTYSNNAEISMMVVLFIFTITHLNSLICEFESLKFSISLINQNTYLNANLISLGLIPVFYTASMICQSLESTMDTALPITVMISSAFTISSMLMFMLIFFIYSYNRFQCDIEFMTGSKPGILVKICLVFPLAFIVCLLTVMIKHFIIKFGLHFSLFIAASSIMALMTICYVAYQYTTLSAEDFKNLFVPSFFYGPPNHDLRKERKKFCQADIHSTM